MKHSKYDKIKQIIELSIPVLIEAEAGTGKSTLCRMIAEDLGLKFTPIGITRQTSVGNLLGFISVTGVYIPSALRDAFENGGLVLLDEIDAGDPNTMLCLNSIENGYLAFPDAKVDMHPNFRLMATANPQDAHVSYVGRSKLDFATRNRYHEEELARDESLEASLTDKNTAKLADQARKYLADQGATQYPITMRSVLRYHKMKHAHTESPEDTLFPGVYRKYIKGFEKIAAKAKEADKSYEDVKSIKELYELMQVKSELKTTSPRWEPELETVPF